MADSSENQIVEQSPIFRSLMRFYAAEARYSASGDPIDRAALLDNLHPDIILYQPDTLPYGGIWRGREAFGQWLDIFVRTWADIMPTDPAFHICGSATLISTVMMRATAASSGRSIAMPMCQIIRFSGEMPVEWRNFAWDTAQMMAALDMPAVTRSA
jgi:uncharacterized protein